MKRLKRLLWACLSLLLLPTLLYAAGNEQTHNTIPTSNASFITTLQSFLKQEDAKRYQEHFVEMVLSGGTHGTVGSLVGAPGSLVAYPGGYYTTETSGTITYVNNSTCYAIAHKDLTGNLSNFVRVAGTHYLIDCISAPKPALPAASVWLMQVTTAGGAITAVTDLRTRVPYAGTYLFAELPAAGQRGRLAFVRDVGSGTIYLDNGTTWLQTVSNNPLTTAGDIFIGGTAGIPARLGIGSANQVLGVVAAGGSHEYKSIVAGSGIAVAHTVNTVTVSQTVFPPTGALQPYMGNSAPSGWLLCDGTEYDADTYPLLFDVYITNAGGWGRGTALGTFTVNPATETLTLTGHGRSNGERVHMANSGGALPTGLSANTKYFVIAATADTMQLSLTSGGGAVDVTAAGSGTHSLYDKFQVPNFNGRIPVGVGASSHDFTISSVNTTTEEITLESNTALFTGDATFYDTTVGAIGGLTDATTYYVIRVSATVVKLAATELAAVTGIAIDLTSSGSGTQVLRQTLTTRTAGTIGGGELVGTTTGTYALTIADMPAHTHTVTTQGNTGGSSSTLSSVVTNTNITSSFTSNSTGGGGGHQHAGYTHSLMNPFLAITFIVKT